MEEKKDERELTPYTYNRVPKPTAGVKWSHSPDERMEALINAIEKQRPVVQAIEVSVIQQDADILEKKVTYRQIDKEFEVVKVVNQ